MFFLKKKKDVKAEPKLPKNLKSKERKKILELFKKAKKDDKKTTAQDSIPIERIFKNGICRCNNNIYSLTIEFSDINYELADRNEREGILDNWGAFLNFFDSSIHVELSFVNLKKDIKEFEDDFKIESADDGFDEIRKEYSYMLKSNLEKGSVLTKTRYLTFSIKVNSLVKAKAKLEPMSLDIIENFNRMGIKARVLTISERLKLMHDMLNINENAKFNFNWDLMIESGMSFKDFIAPSSFRFPNGRFFNIGSNFASMYFLNLTASDIADTMLRDMLSLNKSQILTMHINAIDQKKAVKDVKNTITELDKSKIEENKKAVRAGYDMDILPSDLVSYGEDAKKLLRELQNKNERFFMLTFLILVVGDTKEELESNIFKVSSIVQKHSCDIKRLDFQQENGFMSCLPLANNLIEIERGMTTSSLSILVPFTTNEINSKSREKIYYGLNALSNNPIFIDRKESKNPNGLILGVPGSGKSFTSKEEITSAFLLTDDDIIICDPEREYRALVENLRGQIIEISTESNEHINPLDINMNYSEGKNPISLKSEFILSFFELIIGRDTGLLPLEKVVIDRCLSNIYAPYLDNPCDDNIPILKDLYNELLKQKEAEAIYVATALEIYVKGSLKIFNHKTDIDIHNRIICFDISKLGNHLRKVGMLIVQDQIWSRVSANRNEGKSTRYYIDEFHLLLREEQTALYALEFWKRFRKWGGIPTGITQNVKDFLASREIESIFDNTPFVYMLEQGSNDRDILKEFLHISEPQLSCVTKSKVGEGLIYYEGIIIPVIDEFPTHLKLYKIMSSKFNESIDN